MDKFHVSATGLSMNYLPQYLAEELGYFKDVDIVVTNSVPTDWTQVLKCVDSGEAQAALGGIWVPSIYKQHGIKDYLAFAKLSSRCPMILVSREPVESFEWRYLEGKRILCPGGNGISPYMFLSGCMREKGVDMSAVSWIHDFTAGMLFEGFKCGWGDIIVLPPHMAEMLCLSGEGFECCDLAEVGGDVPWSVYYTRPDLLSREDNLVGRFTAAIQRATAWILKHDASCFKDLLQKNWPAVNINSAVARVNRLRELGMWSGSVRIDESELSHYEGYMVDTGIIDRKLEYAEIFDVGPYNYALSNIKAE